MKDTSILLSILALLVFWEGAVGQVRINETRADDDGGDDVEFVELIGITGTDITGYELVHVNGNGGSNIFTHTIGSFSIPDDGFIDSESNSIGFYVLGAGGFSIGTDESTSTALQNGPDGIILYDDEGNVIDAVAWDGAGDINGDVTTSGSPTADNYMHVTSSDQANDNSLQAPNDVVGDDGSGWKVLSPTIGSINTEQSDGSVILTSSIKAEPANHVTSFTATGQMNFVNLSWTDATGSPTPDAYLIKVSNIGFGSISNPTDGVAVSNDSDMSDDSGALNVNSGVESASFSGLNETTTYYFKIFPYTNTGSDIDYKTDGTIPQDAATTLDKPDIVLNEFLADPPSGSDANKDGTASITQDEFIEFVNTGVSNLNITGWTIEDGAGLAHTFPSTVLEPSQAIVIFSGGSATSNFGGAIAQISTESFTLNNGGDSIILKDNSGIEIINFSYGSSEGSADQSYTRSPDLTGNFTAHFSAEPGNSNFSPGTRLDGFSFIPWLEISGNEGWRMFSSPTSGNTYNDFLGDIWTQCSDGAKYNGSSCSSGTSPNVVIYNGSDFNAVDNLNSNMIPGHGFLVFVYSDDDYTSSGADTGFPKEFQMSGTENSGSVSPSINEGATNTATLVGNPYLAPIDWDELTKNNLTGTVYVYDDTYGTPGSDDVAAAGVSGSYRAWSSSGTGSLTDGLIAPFQGFWVLYDGSGTASLTIEESDKSVGGTFYKEQVDQPGTIRLKAENENMYNEAFFSFTEMGLIGMDNFDGLELTPLDHGNYMSLAAEVDGTLLDINNLPLNFSDPIHIPLHINTYKAIDDGWKLVKGEVRLSWPELKNIPPEWSITLSDKQTGKIINLKDVESYTFQQDGSAAKNQGKKPFYPLSYNHIQKEKSVGESRFKLTIAPGTNAILNHDFPVQFALEQNYPNPFNPTTNIKYEISNSTEVELSIYNVMGQRIAILVNQSQTPGAYEVTWDASDMASGIYHYRLKAGGMVFNRQMTLIK